MTPNSIELRFAKIAAEEADKVAKITTEMAVSNAANAAARGVAEEVDGADVASDRTICTIKKSIIECVNDFERVAKDIFLARMLAHLFAFLEILEWLKLHFKLLLSVEVLNLLER